MTLSTCFPSLLAVSTQSFFAVVRDRREEFSKKEKRDKTRSECAFEVASLMNARAAGGGNTDVTLGKGEGGQEHLSLTPILLSEARL